MGIKNLNSVLKNYTKFPKKTIQNLQNSIIGVDFSLFLYRFIYNQNNPIECFLRQIHLFFKNNILPVYVLDGSAPVEKDITLEKRASKRLKIYNELDKLKELKNNPENSPSKIKILNEEIKRLEKKCVLFSPNIIEDIVHFFNLLGVPVIQEENEESDWILAQLNKNNLIDYILSEDSDLLTFGAKKILKNFSIREENCQIYTIDTILNDLQFTQEQFIDMCILCGCDYTTKIKNINCSKSFSLIKENTNIENIQKMNEYNHINLSNIQKARNVFTKKMPNKQFKSIQNQIVKRNIDFKSLEEFLNIHIEKKYLIPIFLHTCKRFSNK